MYICIIYIITYTYIWYHKIWWVWLNTKSLKTCTMGFRELGPIPHHKQDCRGSQTLCAFKFASHNGVLCMIRAGAIVLNVPQPMTTLSLSLSVSLYSHTIRRFTNVLRSPHLGSGRTECSTIAGSWTVHFPGGNGGRTVVAMTIPWWLWHLAHISFLASKLGQFNFHIPEWYHLVLMILSGLEHRSSWIPDLQEFCLLHHVITKLSRALRVSEVVRNFGWLHPWLFML